MALSRAWEFVRAFPGKTVLILSVELATLTFQRGTLTGQPDFLRAVR